MKARVAGMGRWLPPTVRRNDAWDEAFLARARERGDRTLVDIPPSADRLEVITQGHLVAEARDPFLGAVERRVAVDEPAWLAEAEAARAALADAGVEAGDVDLVMSWSIVSDRASLASAPKVAEHLGARRAWATGVDSGCASAVVQLELAAALIEAGRARVALLTQSHLITRAFPMAHPASPGVGDGATALVVTASERPGVLGVASFSDGAYWDAVIWRRGRTDESDSAWWKAGEDFQPGSKNPAGAKALMRDTVRYGDETVREACARLRVDVQDIAALATVQPRGWIPSAIAQALGLDAARAPDTYREVAHLGGAGVVANLLACRERGLLQPGALVALYAQGAGFTRSAALLRW